MPVLRRRARTSAPVPLSLVPLSLGRAALGTVMLARPGLLPGLLGVEPATSARLTWALQMLGAREVAVGLGAAHVGRSGDRRATRVWLAAGLLCDAVDAAAFAGALGRGQVPRAAGLASVAVAAGAVAAQAADLARR